jgi:acylphosphatase
MQLKSIYLILSGRVQGVGFRYFAKYKADQFGITGWVKNTPDGKLEIEATGNSENLELFIDWMKIGPSRALIKTANSSEITPVRHFTNFSIR